MKSTPKSDPQKDLFEYYVNGKKYTDATGDFAITGTKADREVNLKVVNPVGDEDAGDGKPMDSRDPTGRSWSNRGRICDDDKKGETRR